MTKNRINWIDFGKGFTIFLVLLGHVFLGLYESGKFPSYDKILITITSQIYIFHIPVFFALSGFFFRAVEDLKSFKYYALKRTVVLGLPYIFYSIIHFILQKAAGSSVRVPTTIYNLIDIYKTPLGVSWYLYTLWIISMVYGLLSVYIKRKETLFTLKDGFYVQKFSVVGQYGTHIDAPIHFVEGGRWLDEIELKDLLLPLYIIDKSAEVATNNDYEITKQDILDFEKKYGEIIPESFVAFRSDWSKRWPNYDEIRNLDENEVQHTPGWSREALEFLIKERKVKAVGHETLDTDSGVSAAAEGLVNEYYLLEQDIYQVEVLANLDQVPATGALISVAYPNWTEATGSPARVVAILPEEEK